MKKYKVRLELEVDSIEFGEAFVKANSIEEAKQAAIKQYEDDPAGWETWLTDYSAIINRNSLPNWIVEELE